MKLPRKGDPGGRFEGALPRQRVLDILYENGVSVIHQGKAVLLETDDQSIAQNLPPVVLGDMISYLSRTFDIPVTDFYFSKTHPVH